MYVIAVGVWHHQRCIRNPSYRLHTFLQNGYIPSCDGLHSRLRRDLFAFGPPPYFTKGETGMIGFASLLVNLPARELPTKQA